MNNRRTVIEQLADRIVAVQREHPVRVAIDGVDAAGKTFLADELVEPIEARARKVMRASVDGFHNPGAIRYRLGADSPEGYYRDSFNHRAILEHLLLPLGPGGNRQYYRALFDHQEDAPTSALRREAPSDAVLLFDGVFLLRPELAPFWDFSIFIEVDFHTAVPRAVQRDLQNGAGLVEQTLTDRYMRRYVPGQQIYFQEARPQQNANVRLVNNDFENSEIIWLSSEEQHV